MFCLTVEPLRRKLPRDRWSLMEHLLERPAWTARNVVQLERLLDQVRYGGHEREDAIEERAVYALTEWQRIKAARLLPVDAWCRPSFSRAERAVRLYRRLEDQLLAREQHLRATTRQYKTWAIQSRHWTATTVADPQYVRLTRHLNRVQRIEPNAAWLAQQQRTAERKQHAGS